MSRVIDGVEYLNVTESQTLLGVAAGTFRGLRERYRLHPWKITGGGRRVYFRKSDIETMWKEMQRPIPVEKEQG